MVVVVQTVLAKVADIDIRPAVVVIIRDGNAHAPPLIGHARFRSHIGKRTIVIVMKQRSLRRSRLSVHRVHR